MSNFLTFEERLSIERGLREQLSFGEIGREIGKDRTTIAKEVKRSAFDLKSGYSSYSYNACVHRASCKEKGVCGQDCTRPSSYKCSLCNKCNVHCKYFQEEVCQGRFKPPYVCNGCSEKNNCTLTKLIYNAEKAHTQFAEQLSASRSGVFASEEELARLNAIVAPLVKQGQSIHQIYINHIDELMCSEKTLYNYINACLWASHSGLLL